MMAFQPKFRRKFKGELPNLTKGRYKAPKLLKIKQGLNVQLNIFFYHQIYIYMCVCEN